MEFTLRDRDHQTDIVALFFKRVAATNSNSIETSRDSAVICRALIQLIDLVLQCKLKVLSYHSVAHKLIVFTINEFKNIHTAGLQ